MCEELRYTWNMSRNETPRRTVRKPAKRIRYTLEWVKHNGSRGKKKLPPRTTAVQAQRARAKLGAKAEYKDVMIIETWEG